MTFAPLRPQNMESEAKVEEKIVPPFKFTVYERRASLAFSGRKGFQ